MPCTVSVIFRDFAVKKFIRVDSGAKKTLCSASKGFDAKSLVRRDCCCLSEVLS